MKSLSGYPSPICNSHYCASGFLYVVKCTPNLVAYQQQLPLSLKTGLKRNLCLKASVLADSGQWQRLPLATVTSLVPPPRQIHQTGLVTLATSVPFTPKSTGKENGDNNEVRGSRLRLWGIWNQTGVGRVTPSHMNGPMAMFAQG